jgi:hypothetical protein
MARPYPAVEILNHYPFVRLEATKAPILDRPLIGNGCQRHSGTRGNFRVPVWNTIAFSIESCKQPIQQDGNGLWTWLLVEKSQALLTQGSPLFSALYA